MVGIRKLLLYNYFLYNNFILLFFMEIMVKTSTMFRGVNRRRMNGMLIML